MSHARALAALAAGRFHQVRAAARIARMRSRWSAREFSTIELGWLAELGLRGPADLGAQSPVDVFRAVRAAGYRPRLELLYALEAARRGLPSAALGEDERAELRERAGDSCG